MFNLEFKKIIKRKLFLIIIIGAAILAYNNIDKVSSEFYTNMHSETKENSGNVMNLKTMNKIEELKVNGKIEEAELLQERFGNYRDISEERRLLRLKALEEQGLNKETNKEYILKSNEEINYFNNIAKNFDIKLTQSQRDSIKWDSLKNYYFIENNSYEIDIKDQYNLGRFFRFGNENLFGIVSLLLLAFLSFDSLPKEYENGTIITPYTQPFKKNKIIFAKFFSFMTMTLFYVLSVIIFTIIFTKIKEYPLMGLNSISRYVADQMLYMKTWEYLLLSILCFIILSLLIYSFVLFIGSITKSSLKTMAIVTTSIALLYLVTKSGYFQSTFNPFYLLNYSDILIGKFQVPFTGINLDFTYTQHNALGFFPYLYMLIPTSFFILLSIAFQNITKTKKDKNKTTIVKKPFKNLYSFEFKKIKEFTSPLFILLTTVIVISTIFSITMVNDLKQIENKKGTEGEVSIRKKIFEYDKSNLEDTQILAEDENIPDVVRVQAKMDMEYREKDVERSEFRYNLYKDI